MLTKRLIACFDIIDGRVTKAVRFQDNIDVAPAESLAATLYEAGIDELIFYDITASAQRMMSAWILSTRMMADCPPMIRYIYAYDTGLVQLHGLCNMVHGVENKPSL